MSVGISTNGNMTFLQRLHMPNNSLPRRHTTPKSMSNKADENKCLPLMLCVLILYISDGTYSLKSTPNDRFFLINFSWQISFAFSVFARNLLRGNRRRNNFCISFWCLAWGSNPGFTSNKPTHYLLDCGDFMPLGIATPIIKPLHLNGIEIVGVSKITYPYSVIRLHYENFSQDIKLTYSKSVFTDVNSYD